MFLVEQFIFFQMVLEIIMEIMMVLEIIMVMEIQETLMKSVSQQNLHKFILPEVHN